MPDSEDDHERRNRDKFVREREYVDRPRGRDFNVDRTRRDYSNGSGIKRASGRRDDEPPLVKRNRFDSASDSFEPQFNRKEESGVPVLLTFRKFLSTQDDLISDEEAIAKYLEYKIEFKKQDCENFFQQHKDEEWFRLKYHPEDSKAFKEQQQSALKKRLEVFNFFIENGLIEKINLDYLNAANIIRLLDSVIIKLEDGDETAIEELNNLKDEDLDDEAITEVAQIKEKLESIKSKEINGSNGDINENHASSAIENGADENKNGDESSKKKKLYKTCSIYFKTIPSNAKIADLENICKQHPGFLRIGLTDPLPESKLHRHGWVTYRRDVNIKEIFWSLKNAKLGGFELGAVVNRDLKRRIRPVSGITRHRNAAQNDIRQAAKLVALYDYRTKLFPDESLEDLEKAIIDSRNPILKGIVDYLVEEECAEEEALLGLNSSGEAKVPLEIDKSLLKVLDKLILYLRIVHSIDFYNSTEYPNEDNMPNRCVNNKHFSVSILHVRNVEPSKDDSFVTIENSKTLILKKFIDESVSNFNERLTSSLLKNATISDEELEKLGKKDAEKAVEDFINQNCVELQKDKWLCPLSGKKFKGAEFIRKHLQSKHAEKLSEVRDERPHVELPKRSSSPVTLQPAGFSSQVSNQGNFGSDFDRRLNDSGYRNWNNGGQRGFGGNRGFQGGNRDFGNRSRYFDPSLGSGGLDNNGRRDPRQQIAYRDLDAPEDVF